ncbi:P-loop NTPase family protein [Cucumibacter marinus]|uniref:hypothetical protein n=1 Tax=Cucumibacter marinus TaxID=1121252 RepID=UPI000407AF14|nr:hypothetical protein [Cucumibacter marinus]
MCAQQLAFDLPHAPALSEADFVVSGGNEAAYRHICAFPDWPVALTLILGPAKAGKSHLALIWAERAGAAFADPDMGEDVLSLDGPLVVEDADSGRYDETVLFNLLNQGVRGDRTVLLTARRPIDQWSLATNDVKSRLRLATVFTVEPLDEAHLAQMFVKLFADRQVTVDPAVLRYLLPRMERSPAEVVALVETMDGIAMSRGRSITRKLAAEALEIRANEAKKTENAGENGVT